jgi:predicted regulator of Ras-like GTPase activity (Roadblock/LC7/MglB family)
MKSFRLTLSAPERRAVGFLKRVISPGKAAPPAQTAVLAPAPVATETAEVPVAIVKAPALVLATPIISPSVPEVSIPQAPAPVSTPAPALVTTQLSALCETWPEPVRRDIAQFNWENASVSLPMDRLELAMKTGRVAFKWGDLIQWLDNSTGTVATSHCETVVQLPLKVIAPLFMAQQRTPVAQKNVVVDHKVPNLFAMAGQPVAPVPPPPASAPEVIAAPPAPVAPVVPDAPTDPLGRIFGQPAKDEWSPQEITQRINALPGVSASLIAMSDGFLVAGSLPAPLKSETMAAFLPQIFGRMSNYSGEIQLGPLTALTLQAGQSPVTIYKTGALYLTVMGKPGDTLPEALLHQVAEELAKRN